MSPSRHFEKINKHHIHYCMPVNTEFTVAGIISFTIDAGASFHRLFIPKSCTFPRVDLKTDAGKSLSLYLARSELCANDKLIWPL